jgi:hypothetical protein
VYKQTFTTVRPNTDVPFFINTPLGQEYEKLAVEARDALPTSDPTLGVDQENALIGFNRVESPDGLTLTTTFLYVSSTGKDQFKTDLDARALAKNMELMQTVRNAYNDANNHSSTVEFEII